MEAEFERVLGALTRAPLLLKRRKNPSKTDVLDDQEMQLRRLRNAQPLNKRHATITGFTTVSAEVVYQIDRYIKGENSLTIGGELFIHLQKESKFELKHERSHYLDIREARNILMTRLDELFSSFDVETRRKYESEYIMMKEEYVISTARKNVIYAEEEEYDVPSKKAAKDDSEDSEYSCPYSEDSEDSQNPHWY